MRYFLTLLCLAALPAFAAELEKAVGQPFVYKTVNGRELTLFVSKPADWKANDRRPALVFFHGGGWVGGAPSRFNGHCSYFASRGLVCATVEYRLIGRGSNETPLVCIQDAKSAMRWVRSHAGELGIDPARIAAAGGSAGGHLAAFCGLVEGKDDPHDNLSVSPKPNAMVLYNPVFNNGPGEYGHGRVSKSYLEFSPAHHITSNAPPTVVFFGTKDHLVPVKTAQAFQSEMKKVGVPCDLHLYEGEKHGFYGAANPKSYYETMTETDRFLVKLGWLKGSPTFKMPQAKAEKDLKGERRVNKQRPALLPKP